VAFLRVHAVSRRDDLHKLAGERDEQIRALLLHLPHQVHQRYRLPHAGNYSKNNFTAYDGYIVTIVPALNLLILFLFYLCWKAHFFACINEQEEDNSDVKPEKFCLEIEAEDEGYFNQEELTRFFSSFGPVYEVSLVRRYKNKLSYF
jgi:hypothetical protein